MSEDFSIVVLASCGGGNFQSLINFSKEYEYKIALLITDRKCGAISHAIENGIKYYCIEEKGELLFKKMEELIPSTISLIVLAGFMSIIPSWMCDKWKGKIINTHPSLLPKYGGKGMYGVKVQEAVMKAREKYAGCTVHYVEAGIDTGRILAQKSILVDYSDTPWELGGKIFLEETKLLPLVVKNIKENGII